VQHLLNLLPTFISPSPNHQPQQVVAMSNFFHDIAFYFAPMGQVAAGV